MSDLIEKQAVIDALLSKMDTIDDKPDVVLGMAVAAGMIKDMPSALEQEPCDDAINRQAVFEIIRDFEYKNSHEEMLINSRIKQLPFVTPAEKVGHWEWVQYDSNPNIGNWHCSECRTIIPHMPEETDNTPIYKWCPMCGAKMQEVDGC